MTIKHFFLFVAMAFVLSFGAACGETSAEECESSHSCTNGVCECTTEGKEGEPCDDADSCPEQCEVCD